MTTLAPNSHATARTGTITLPAARAARTRITTGLRAAFETDLPGQAVRLLAAVTAFAAATFALILTLAGFGLAALPMALIALGILAAAHVPAIYAARLDTARAQQDAEDAAEAVAA